VFCEHNQIFDYNIDEVKLLDNIVGSRLYHNVPCVNFINVLREHFLYKILAPKITKLCFGFEVLVPKILYEKCACIMLMKLTP